MQQDKFGIPSSFEATVNHYVKIAIFDDAKLHKKTVSGNTRCFNFPIYSGVASSTSIDTMNYSRTFVADPFTWLNPPQEMYYEVSVKRIGDVKVGYFFGAQTGISVLYKASTGELQNGHETTPYGYPAKEGDVIGCGLLIKDMCNMWAYFVHNGRPLRYVQCNVKPYSFPCQGLCVDSVDCSLSVDTSQKPGLRGPPLANRLYAALDNPQYFPDVCFCFDGTHDCILAHKAIIAARCPALARRCCFGTGKGSPVELVAVDEEPASFRRLLEFVYAGVTTVSGKSDLEALFCAASKAGHEALAQRISRMLGVLDFTVSGVVSLDEVLASAFREEPELAEHYAELFAEKEITERDISERGVAIMTQAGVLKDHARMIEEAYNWAEMQARHAKMWTVAEPPWVLERDIHKMLHSKLFTDAQLVCGEHATVVPCHRVMLAAMSDHFKGLLQKNFLLCSRARDGGKARGGPLKSQIVYGFNSSERVSLGETLSQEYTIDDCTFTVVRESPSGTPTLLLGSTLVPLDVFTEVRARVKNVSEAIYVLGVNNFSIEDVRVWLNNNEEDIPNGLSLEKTFKLGVFHKLDTAPYLVQHCYWCWSLLTLSNCVHVGVCEHVMCRPCFIAIFYSTAKTCKSCRTISDFIAQMPHPICPCGLCTKRMTWSKILPYIGLREEDSIETLGALLGTEKLRNADMRRVGLPFTVALPPDCGITSGALRCYLSFLYSGYNKAALKLKHATALRVVTEAFMDNQLETVLKRMATQSTELDTKSLRMAQWAARQPHFQEKDKEIDVGGYMQRNFAEFVLSFSRYAHTDQGILAKADFYARTIPPEMSMFPYVVLYKHYRQEKIFFCLYEAAFRKEHVLPRDALIKYYVARVLGFDDLRERARNVILHNPKVDPASPSFANTFRLINEKDRAEILNEFLDIVRLLGADPPSADDDGTRGSCCCCCCVCGNNNNSGKIRCCVCGRPCCNNFKRKNNCSTALPAVPPEMDWVEGPGVSCVLCRKVAVMCYLN